MRKINICYGCEKEEAPSKHELGEKCEKEIEFDDSFKPKEVKVNLT